jgi:pSer/pThr/pTyr-binding forkhead associated (FHA) protein/tetratricopeptide (TPR) repeat protein
MAVLRIQNPEGGERIVELGSDPVTVGRSSDSTVPVTDVKLSRKHCMFAQSARGFYVEDLNSRNGTKVNGKDVQRHLLRNGDLVEAGSVAILFEAASPRAQLWTTETGEAEFVLYAKGGEEHEKNYRLRTSVTVGRQKKNDIVLDYEEVSGEHLRIEVQAGRVNLEDLESTNGTLVNGMRVHRAQIKHGDEIEVGPVAFLFINTLLDYKDLKKRFLRRKHTHEAEFCLVETAGLGESFDITDIPFHIGSGPENHLVIERETVSGRHARILREPKGFSVEDLGSTNGTLLNGEPVRKSRAFHGDLLTFGDAEFFLKNEEFPLPEPGAEEAEVRQKRLIFYGGVLLLAVVLVVALFTVLDMMESKPVKVDREANLLRANPSFEKPAVGETLPGWRLQRTGPAAFHVDDRVRAHGHASLRIQCPRDADPQAEAVARADQKLKLTAGAVYLFGASVKVVSCQGLAGLRVRWMGSAAEPFPVVYSDLVTGNTRWLEIRSYLRVPKGVTGAELEMVALGAAGTVWFDDVRVERAEAERKGRSVVMLGQEGFEGIFSPRGVWALKVGGIWKITRGAFAAVSPTGVFHGGQETCLPAEGFPRRTDGFFLRAEVIKRGRGISIPLELKAVFREETLHLTYRFDPENRMQKRSLATVSFRLPPRFSSWGFTAVADEKEVELPFKNFDPVRNVTELVFRDDRDVLKLKLSRPAVCYGYRRGEHLDLVVGWPLSRSDLAGIVTLKLAWVLPPGRLEARGLELLQKAQARFKAGELGEALVIFEKVRSQFKAFNHLVLSAERHVRLLFDAAVKRQREIEDLVEGLRATHDEKSLEDALFKTRELARLFRGSRFARTAVKLADQAIDIFAETGSPTFRQHLGLFRRAQEAYRIDDWAEALRAITEIQDSLEDTPISFYAEELRRTIKKRQADTEEVETFVHLRMSTARELEAEGNVAQAIDALREIVRRYPSSDWAKKALGEIRRLDVR